MGVFETRVQEISNHIVRCPGYEGDLQGATDHETTGAIEVATSGHADVEINFYDGSPIKFKPTSESAIGLGDTYAGQWRTTVKQNKARNIYKRTLALKIPLPGWLQDRRLGEFMLSLYWNIPKEEIDNGTFNDPKEWTFLIDVSPFASAIPIVWKYLPGNDFRNHRWYMLVAAYFLQPYTPPAYVGFSVEGLRQSQLIPDFTLDFDFTTTWLGSVSQV